MKNLSFRNFIESSGIKTENVIELGGGDGEDANFLSGLGVKNLVMIDRKKSTQKIDERINFIEADYFNDETVKNQINGSEYDLIFSCCSLCFNSKQKIEENLPFYLNKIRRGGYLYILDFADGEQVVTKRTNLWDGWFFSLLNRYFDHLEINTQEIFEEAHGHSHRIFELVCSNRIE